jgi:hypothetical protein
MNVEHRDVSYRQAFNIPFHWQLAPGGDGYCIEGTGDVDHRRMF